MFALRRLTTAASRSAARPASALGLTLTRATRPQSLAELRVFESVLQQRWYSENGEDVAERVPVHRNLTGGGERQENDGMAMQPPHKNLPPTKVIYVGNLKYEVTIKDLEEKFQEFGEIRGIRIPRTNDTGIPRGFAYIEFATLAQSAEAIENMHQAPFHGRRLNCQYVNRQDMRIKNNPESKTLFIGNLSFNTTDDDLNELFKDIAGCVDVRVAMDRRTGQPRGFVHADFADVASAVKARSQLEGTQLYGRQIRIDFSVPPEERKEQWDARQRERGGAMSAPAAEAAEQTEAEKSS